MVALGVGEAEAGRRRRGTNSDGEAQWSGGWGHGGGELVAGMSCSRGGESFYRVGR
jgi:hypothetical protein